ncbi:MAG: DUF5711 family protein [Eubacteriales bacterium]
MTNAPAPKLTHRRSVHDGAPRENKYYLEVATRFRLAKFVSLTLFIALLLSMISIYRDEITVENLRYLVKYLDTDAPEYTGKYRTIYFDSSNEMQLGVYKGELAAVSSGSVSLYNMLGNSTMSYSISATRPVLLTGTQYMLVYGMNENNFTINNAFSQLYSETTDYPITGAAISDSGMFAIITKNLEYRGVVCFYDKSFNVISRVLKDKLIMCAAMSPDGSRAAVISAYSGDGDYVTEVMCINPYSDTPEYTVSANDTLGLTASFAPDGTLRVICDDRILFFDKNGEQSGEYSYGSSVPISFYFSDKGSAFVFNENVIGSDNRIVLLDNTGSELTSYAMSGQIVDVCTDGENLYVMTGSAICRIPADDGDILTDGSGAETVTLQSGCKQLLLKDQMTLMVCYTHKTDTYLIAELFGGGKEQTAPETSAETKAPSITAPPETAAETTAVQNQSDNGYDD